MPACTCESSFVLLARSFVMLFNELSVKQFCTLIWMHVMLIDKVVACNATSEEQEVLGDPSPLVCCRWFLVAPSPALLS